MPRLPHHGLRVAATLLVLVVILAACTPNPRAQLISPDMVVLTGGEEFVPPTPTAVPDITVLSDEEIYAGLPEGVASLMPADAAAGQSLSVANGCVGCHQLDPEQQIVAPTWHNVANMAIERAQRTNSPGPAAYLYSSIVAPNAYVVEGYNAGVMPQNYGEVFGDEEMANIVTYLLSLNQTSGE